MFFIFYFSSNFCILITHINTISPTIPFFCFATDFSSHVLILRVFLGDPLFHPLCDNIFEVSHYVSLYEGDTQLKPPVKSYKAFGWPFSWFNVGQLFL